MDIPIHPGDTLAQPTRARLFELLGQQHGPMGTEELAEHIGLHPNGIRTHLERLQEAGLVERRRERIARGRPRDMWTIRAGARPGGAPPTGYSSLARWLVRSLVANRVRVGDMEETGRRIGRGIATSETASDEPVEQRMFDALSSLGFAPEREPVSVNRLNYRLCNCPYRDAVRERQPLVCGLHRGLTRGMLEGLDPESRLVGFEPKDPDLAGCLIRLRGPVARQASGDERET